MGGFLGNFDSSCSAVVLAVAVALVGGMLAAALPALARRPAARSSTRCGGSNNGALVKIFTLVVGVAHRRAALLGVVARAGRSRRWSSACSALTMLVRRDWVPVVYNVRSLGGAPADHRA